MSMDVEIGDSRELESTLAEGVSKNCKALVKTVSQNLIQRLFMLKRVPRVSEFQRESTGLTHLVQYKHA